jgi:beta-lactamase class D
MRKLLVALSTIIVFFSACSVNNVSVDDSLGRFFDSAGVQGCFALYDNGQGKFTVYNLPRYRDSAYPAGSTFDIVASLIGFQSGVIKDDKAVMLVGWRNVADSGHPGQQVQQDVNITLGDAFKSNGFEQIFRHVEDSIGMDSLRKWVDSLHYGNQALDKDTNAVYDGSLTIPADEQLGLIKKLYFNQLPFFQRNQELVRGMMSKVENSNYKLVIKVATVPYKDHVLGWVLGWIEENKHPYFFALNLESADPHANAALIGTHIVERILPSLGFFEGKK